MITLTPKQQFLIFCLEKFKTEKNIAGNLALKIFKKNKVIEYLNEGFEVLHTQGEKYILADILDFLKQRE